MCRCGRGTGAKVGRQQTRVVLGVLFHASVKPFNTLWGVRTRQVKAFVRIRVVVAAAFAMLTVLRSFLVRVESNPFAATVFAIYDLFALSVIFDFLCARGCRQSQAGQRSPTTEPACDIPTRTSL